MEKEIEIFHQKTGILEYDQERNVHNNAHCYCGFRLLFFPMLPDILSDRPVKPRTEHKQKDAQRLSPRIKNE